jgi:ADP-ribose pyrophosphatase
MRMSRAEGPVFRGKTITVGLETATFPDGRTGELEIVRHPGGAAVVAIDERDRICLLRHYRHVAAGWLWELPAGRLEPDEPPLETARRELAEEAGLHAERWTPLGPIWSSPGVFAETIHLFAAGGLTPVTPQREDDEYLEVHWVPFSRALAWARNGEIRDAKTLVGLFRAAPIAAAGGEEPAS